MRRITALISLIISALVLTSCYDPVWQSISAVGSGGMCSSITVVYTATNPSTEPQDHVIQVYQVVGNPDPVSAETDDILLNPSANTGIYASKPEGASYTYTLALDTPVADGTAVYALADSNDGPSPSYPAGSRSSAVVACNSAVVSGGGGPVVSVPNLGMIMITTAQAQPVYETAGGGVVRINGAELWLPADADSSGFDTYVVTEVRELNGAYWVGIFLGSNAWGWVPLDSVTPLVYIDGT